MHVEETHLRDRLRANVLIVFILRTRFQTTPTRHAARIRITFHYVVLVHARTRTKIVSSIQLDPRVHAPEMIEHPRTIHDQVTHVRKLRHRFELDWLVKFIHQGRTRLTRAAVDDHREIGRDTSELQSLAYLVCRL